MDKFDRYFTLEEANAVLEEILPDIEDLMAIRNRIVEIRPELESGLEKALGNGGSQATGELLGLMSRASQLVGQIQGTGALMKDLDRGSLDFPSDRDGQVVFLCWQYGEPSITYWHDIEAGFTGRQLL